MAGTARSTPLHDVDPRPPASEVALLMGHVEAVDGEVVSTRGSSFELLPGCHVVRTPEKWGRTVANQGGVMVDTGKQLFALLMKPGHTYVVEVEVSTMTGPVGSARLLTYEKDANGNVTGAFGPVQNPRQIESCQATAR